MDIDHPTGEQHQAAQMHRALPDLPGRKRAESRNAMKAQYRNRKNGKSFNPNHQQVQDAILEFQSRGGSIHRVDTKKDDLDSFVAFREERAVDEFLNDPGYVVRY